MSHECNLPSEMSHANVQAVSVRVEREVQGEPHVHHPRAGHYHQRTLSRGVGFRV